MSFSKIFGFLFVFNLAIVAIRAQEAPKELTEEELLKWEAPADYSKDFPYYLSGLDNDGAQVWVVDFGKWDIRAIADAGGKRLDNLKIYIRQMYTRAAEKNRKGVDPSKFSVVIIDMDGFTAEKASHVKGNLASLDMLRSFEKFAREGGFKKGFIVNANFLFETVWRVSKPLIGRLNELVEVYGTNHAKWSPRLLKYIPSDQLPVRFGGSKDHKYLAIYG